MAKKTKKTEAITKKFGDERKKALDDALKLIEKDFGKGAVMRLGERAEQKVQVMSTGSLALDIALGAGGYPKLLTQLMQQLLVLISMNFFCHNLTQVNKVLKLQVN